MRHWFACLESAYATQEAQDSKSVTRGGSRSRFSLPLLLSAGDFFPPVSNGSEAGNLTRQLGRHTTHPIGI